MDNIRYVMFTNFGCSDLCLNALRSAQKVGISLESFDIYSLDDQSDIVLRKFGIEPITKFRSEYMDYQNWDQNNQSPFYKVASTKWLCILDSMSNNPNDKIIGYLDSDIFFRKNPNQFVSDYFVIENFDLISQWDHINMCTGVVYLRNSESIKEMINLVDRCGLDDQIGFNKILNEQVRCGLKLKYGVFSLEDMATGKSYFDMKISPDAYIVHNNWIVGIESKIARFKDSGLWIN